MLSDLIGTFGGFCGIAVAIFTIWDRVVRARPTVNVMAEVPEYAGLPALACVAIRNSEDRDIIVNSIGTDVEPDVHVGYDSTTKSIIYASMGVKQIAIIRPSEERRFHIWVSSEFEGEFTLDVDWRFVTDTRRALRPWPIRLKLSAQLIRNLEEEAQRRREGEAP